MWLEEEPSLGDDTHEDNNDTYPVDAGDSQGKNDSDPTNPLGEVTQEKLTTHGWRIGSAEMKTSLRRRAVAK